ncbi:MAG: DUF3343 domain-containing protein [Defluviitaleaceae bacterium]|nr:DUF3343 domain-containing protein [Defluviitaleaceae bacterium]
MKEHKEYIVTFYSHYDALVFSKFLKGQGVQAKLMPTPRKLGASCGTCVSFATDKKIDFDGHEIEAVHEQTPRA